MLDYYYMQLRKCYPNVKEREEVAITMQELAGIFQCSGRNVNLVLRRMEETAWIRWIPGRGRGNSSRMVFLIPAEEVALETAQGLVEKGDIQQAFAFLEEQSHLPSVKDRFVYWLDTHFGFHPEVRGKQRSDILRSPYSKPIRSPGSGAADLCGGSSSGAANLRLSGQIQCQDGRNRGRPRSLLDGMR
ncbi:SgrR family transcriptional regulator [Paenibacillus sp. P25]|nr:SgrR family transcriptional regulator [Paenibacillus sp. P25]